MARVQRPGTVEPVRLAPVPAPRLPRPQGLASGIEQAAAVLGELGRQMQRDQTAAEAAEAEAEFEKRVQQLENDVLQTDRPGEAHVVFQKQAETHIEQVVQRVSDPQARRILKARLRRRVAVAAANVQSKSISLTKARARDALGALLETTADRAARSDSPNEVAFHARRIDQQLAELVENGTIGKDEADEFKRSWQESVEEKRVLRFLAEDNPKAAQAALKAARHLPVEKELRLKRMIEASARQTDELLAQDIQRAAEYVQAFGRLPDNMADIAARASLSGNARYARAVREIARAGADIERIIRKPATEMAQDLRKLRESVSGTDGMLRYKLVSRGVASFLELVKNDPLQAAERAGVVSSVEPIDLTQPDPEAGRRRLAQMEIAREHFGLPATTPPLTREELSQLRSVLETGGEQDIAAVVGSLAQTFGPETAGLAVASAAGRDRPEIAVAGDLLARGDDEMALLVLRGMRIEEFEKGAVRAEIPSAGVRAAMEDILGDMFFYAPQMRAHLEQAAVSAYIAEAARKGIKTWDDKLFRDVLRRLVKPVEFNGYPVIPPQADWTEDDFAAAVWQVKPEQLRDALVDNGLGQLVPLTKDDLKKARFEYAGPGYYMLRFGDGMAVTETGEPFVLRLERPRSVAVPVTAADFPAELQDVLDAGDLLSD